MLTYINPKLAKVTCVNLKYLGLGCVLLFKLKLKLKVDTGLPKICSFTELLEVFE